MIGKPTTEPSVHAEKVWRYLRFSRFVWLLQKRQFWLSRTDLLTNGSRLLFIWGLQAAVARS
jgi:hypothetical protein